MTDPDSVPAPVPVPAPTATPEADPGLHRAVKELMVQNLMLPASVEEIGDAQPLFGPGGLGLDSVDALQLVVALDKEFGLKITDQAVAQEVLRSVATIAGAIGRHRAAGMGN